MTYFPEDDGSDMDAATFMALRDALRNAMPLLDRAESNASGNPEYDYVRPRVVAARAALKMAGVAS